MYSEVKGERPGIIGGQLKFLSNDQMKDIDYTAKDILWRIGIKVPHKEAMDIFHNHGCVVDYEKEHVCIPPYLVDEAVRNTPKGFNVGGRDPKKFVRLEGNRVYFVVGAGGTWILGSDGVRRKGTLKDYQDIVRLTDACENVDIGGADLEVNVPEEWLNLPLAVRRARLDLLRVECTEKPVDMTTKYVLDREMTSVDQAKQNALDRINFGIAIRGSIEELLKMPMSWGTNEPISPLMMDPTNVEASLCSSKLGLPTMIGSEPMAGATSPATVAGTVSLWTAETLSCLVLSQLAGDPEHRSPACWVTLAGLFDQKTGAGPLFSSPEGVLMQAASAEMAHYYGFPIRGNAESNSQLPDAQSGYETALDLYVSALVGINYNTSTGMMGPGQMGMSLEKIVLDNDLIGYIKRLLEGVNVCDETLAFDVIDKVGIGGNYLKHRHTLKWAKKEQYYPHLFDRSSYEDWARRGRKDAVKRAQERIQEILKDHWPEPLDPDIRKRVEEYVKTVEKRESHKR